MKKIIPLLMIVVGLNTAHAAKKLSVDLVVDDLKFKKPARGVGHAGNLIFKSANVNNDGIILNINNVNNYFDSQIFLRPTFLGFTTQFGNYGVTLEEENIFTNVDNVELKNSKIILDDSQLSLSGEHLKYVDSDMRVSLDKFRLYCQNPLHLTEEDEAEEQNMMTNCLGYLVLNGAYDANNKIADLELEAKDKATGEVLYLKSKVDSVDVRSDYLAFKLGATKTTSNNSYEIQTDNLEAKCAKDATLLELNQDKMIKDCLNDIKVRPLRANLVDQASKTKFNLNLKDFTVKEKIAYLDLPSASLSDPTSTTYLSNLKLNCKKELETDLLDLMQVLRDCTSYARISLDEVKSTKPDEDKGSSIKNILINSSANVLVLQASVKVLGFNSKVTIYGRVELNEVKKELIVSVTDTKMPLGLSSVKLLMYFIKKNLISKDVRYSGNNIIVSL